LVARWHGHAHRVAQLRPATMLKLFGALDAFRRPQRMEDFLLACEADARGRAGLEERPYPQAERLRAALRAAAAVEAAPLAARGLRGPAIGRELFRQRVEAIRRSLPG